jgi:hypothetical protein
MYVMNIKASQCLQAYLNLKNLLVLLKNLFRRVLTQRLLFDDQESEITGKEHVTVPGIFP